MRADQRAIADVIWADVFDPAALAETLEQIDDGYEGVAVVALDHPMVPLTWLANELSRTGIGMKAGQMISTGTLTGMLAPKPGESNPDAFRIQSDRGSVFIAGATPEATGFAVSWLL